MKVIILNNWGGTVPKMLKPYANGGNSWRWGQVIQFIETNAVNADRFDVNPINAKVICYPGTDKNSKTYLFKEDNVILSIVDVDTSRPWCIEKYDGSEYVQYLDYDIIDKKINFCELPKC
jgi:hypothetical protein